MVSISCVAQRLDYLFNNPKSSWLTMPAEVASESKTCIRSESKTCTRLPADATPRSNACDRCWAAADFETELVPGEKTWKTELAASIANLAKSRKSFWKDDFWDFGPYSNSMKSKEYPRLQHLALFADELSCMVPCIQASVTKTPTVLVEILTCVNKFERLNRSHNPDGLFLSWMSSRLLIILRTFLEYAKDPQHYVMQYNLLSTSDQKKMSDLLEKVPEGFTKKSQAKSQEACPAGEQAVAKDPEPPAQANTPAKGKKTKKEQKSSSAKKTSKGHGSKTPVK